MDRKRQQNGINQAYYDSLYARNVSPKLVTEPSKKSIQNRGPRIEQYQIFTKIGEGAYGQVRLAKQLETSQMVALKMISKELVAKYKADDNIMQEITNQKKLDHENVLKLIENFDDPSYIYIVVEYCPGGNLYQQLRQKGCFSEQEAFIYFYQTCLALDHIHFKGIVHRDIKPENILLFDDKKIKLCDFNWSASLNGQRYVKAAYCGTVDYMAPEIIQDKPLDQKVDIWALGILLYELIHGKPPFKGSNDKEKCQNILNSQSSPIDSKVSPLCQNLIKLLLTQDPTKRPSIVSVFQHLWMETNFKQINVRNPYREYKKVASPTKFETSMGSLTSYRTPRQNLVQPRVTSPQSFQTSSAKSNKLVSTSQATDTNTNNTTQITQPSELYGVKQYQTQTPLSPRPFQHNFRNKSVWERLMFVLGFEDEQDKKKAPPQRVTK